MAELMALLQALLLIAGWLLFLRAQTELRAQAARQSLTGELEELRQTVDALLHKLAEEAAQTEARIEARLRELEHRSTDIPLRAQEASVPEQECPSYSYPTTPEQETFTSDSGYNFTAYETSPYGAVAMLAQQGLSVSEIARQTGYALGEVELILSLKRRNAEENG
ncbi:MAG: hypothetical protein P3X24_001880 [bacterium]|nr:hypothetical protein [bacterium]